MTKLKALLVSASALLLTTILVSCGGSDNGGGSSGSAAGLLKYIPADTPYLFVTQDQAPDALMDKLEPQLDRVLRSYHQILVAALGEAMAKPENETGDEESLQQAAAFVEELEDLFTVDGLDAVGINRDSRVALFGHGLLPVFRLSLSDGNLLEAEIERLEDSAGASMETAAIDGNTYRFLGDDEGRIIVAIIEDELVVTVALNQFDDDELRTILGLNLPEDNIGDAGTLGALANQYDFDDLMIGLIDLERLATTFLNAPTGINASLLSGMEFDPSELDDVCRAEIQDLAGVVPRIVTGYTEVSTERFGSRAIIEVRDDIAASMTGLTGSVPGLGLDFDGLASFGMSFDLAAMREFYSDRLDALEADPFECELFAEQQAGIQAGREILNQPIPPIVYGFQGILAQIESLEGMNVAQQIPPTDVDLRLLIATNNAQGLIAMGAMFSPEVAALNLEPGGDPVKLETAQLAMLGQVAYAAISDDGLAISVGEGMQDGLNAMLETDSPDNAPFMSFDVDAASYYDFMAMGASDDDLADNAELQEAVKDLMAVPRDIFERLHVDILFTQNGIELTSETTLKD